MAREIEETVKNENAVCQEVAAGRIPMKDDVGIDRWTICGVAMMASELYLASEPAE